MQKKVVNVIQKDAYDVMVFDGAKASPKVSTLCESGEGLIQDVFNCFYKMDPKIDEESTATHKPLLQSLMGLNEFEQARASTQIDDVSSALATLAFAPELVSKLEEIEKKMEQKDSKGNKPESVEEVLDDATMAGIRNAFRATLQEAQEEADEWAEIKSGWGIEEGDLQKMSLKEKLELAENLRNNAKVKNISDMVGRFRNLVRGVETQVSSHGYDEVIDITQGDDLANILPSELLKLEMTPELFYVDLVERRLLQYNLKGVEDQGKGPLIVCSDVSGSMTFGNREVLAKAMIIALMQLAAKEKRPFGLITFETKVVSTQFWPKNSPATLEDKLEVLNIQSVGGGTNFEVTLDTAVKMRDQNLEFKPADIVFVTDGDFICSQAFIEKFEKTKVEKDVRVHGVCVEARYEKYLQPFCDFVAVVSQSGELTVAKELVKRIANKK